MWKTAVRSKGFWFGLALSCAGLWWALKGVGIDQLKEDLSNVPWLLVLAAGAMSVGGSVMRSYRWKIGVDCYTPVKFRRVCSAFFVGIFGLNVIPLRVGESLRVYVLGKNSSLNYSPIFATVVFERVMDGLTVMTIFGTALLVLPGADYTQFLGRVPKEALLVIPAMFAVGLGILYSFWKFPNAWISGLGRLFRAVGRRAETLPKTAEQFSAGLIIFSNRKRLVTYIFWSFAAWFMMGFYLYVTGLILDLPLSLTQAMVVLTATVVGAMIPAAPGFVGTYHAFCKKTLTAFGVPASKALTFAVVSHAVPFIAHVLIGFVCVMRENIRISEISAQASGAADLPAGGSKS